MTDHTDTSRSGDLIKRLRDSFEYDRSHYAPDPLVAEAADRIEALSAEKDRLREALGWFLNDSRFVVQVGGNPYVVPQMIEAARAALGETE